MSNRNYITDIALILNKEKLEAINEFNIAFENHLDLLDIDLDYEYSEESDIELNNKLEKWIYVNLWHGGDNIISKSIMAQTKSIYSHSSISLDKYGKPFYEMQIDKGFRISSYFDHINLSFGKEEGRIIDFYGIQIDQHRFDRYTKILERYEKKSDELGYSIRNLFKIAFKIFQKKGLKTDSMEYVKKQTDFICSGFVLGVLMQNDPRILRYVRNHNQRWELYSPGELINLPGLEQLHTIDYSHQKATVQRNIENFEKKNNLDLN